jgi:ribosome-associated toxin RatA of RatAB toxin-antitoxin module
VEILDEDTRQMHAALHVDYKGIKQRFSTRNRFTEPAGAQAGSIVMALVEGPFRSLDGNWSFKPLGEDACKIEFALHYEFSSKLLERVFGPVFRHIANSFVDAFFRRAEALYASR